MPLVLLSKQTKPGLSIYSPGEKQMRRAFDSYVGTLTDAANQMSADELVRNIDKLPWKDAEDAMVQQWEEMVEGAAGDGFKNGKGLLKIPKDEDKKRLVFSLDNPHSKKWAKMQSALLVTEVCGNTRKAIRGVISDGFARNRTVAQMARDLRGYKDKSGKFHRGVIGLHSRDSGAVSGYMQRLLDKDVPVERAQELSSRYAQRLLNRRGATIARTETAMAQTHGALLAWREAEQKNIISKRSLKKWVTAWDERTCPVCAPLHNVTVKLGEEFPGGFDGPPAHPNCRCALSIITIVPGMRGRELPKKPDAKARRQQAERRAEHNRAQAKLNRKRLRRGTGRK